MAIKNGAIVEARMTSRRLPGKTMLPILGAPMLHRLIERLKRANTIDGIIIATTTNATDDILEAAAADLGVGCYRGSEDDVLSRVVEAAECFGVETIVEITADCPVIDPAVVDKVVTAYYESGCDYVTNSLQSRTYPIGLDVRVFSARNLADIEKITSDPSDREHVSLYFYEVPGRYTTYNVDVDIEPWQSALRLTVDSEQDYNLIVRIYELLYEEKPDFDLSDILDLMAKRPDLANINKAIRQKAVR